MKKALSLFLALLMTFSVFSCSVAAAYDDYSETIQSISFEKKDDFYLIENSGGYWADDDTTDVPSKFYEYYFNLFSDGDILTVNFKDGTSKVYTYTYIEDYEGYKFVDSISEELPYDYELYYSDGQYSDHWTLGVNYCTLTYMGVTCKVPVEVKESPVKSVSYTRAEPDVVIEGFECSHCTSSRWDDELGDYVIVDEFYIYDHYRENGDKLTVNYKDGTSKTFTYGYYDNKNSDGHYRYFADSDGNELPGEERNFSIYDTQEEVHWTVGTNYFTVEYMGVTCQVPFIIMENPVKSVSYQRTAPFSLVENADGMWDSYEIYNEETEEYESVEFFRYFDYGRVEGDKLTVNYKDGTSKVFTYDYYETENSEGYNRYFADPEGNELPYENDYLYTSDNQSETPWKVGTNYFELKYMNAKCSVPVQVVENPIKSISYLRANTEPIIENSHGYWDERSVWNEEKEDYDYEVFFRYYYGTSEGDKLTVNYKDGTSKTYTYDHYENASYEDEYYFFGDTEGNVLPYYDNLHFYNDQYNNHWKVGTNYFRIEYMGASCEVPVTIVENPVKSIAYKPVSTEPLIENTNGRWDECSIWNDETEDYDYEEFYYYYYGNSKGDKLTVNYKNGTKKTFIYDYYETENSFGDNYYFADSEGKELPYEDGMSFTSDQYNNHWKVGTNYYTVEYLGVTCDVPVKIIESPVKSVSYVSANAEPVIENSNGYWEERSVWNEEKEDYDYEVFFRYYFGTSEGDKLTVNYKDGTSKTFTYDYYETENSRGWNHYFADSSGKELPNEDNWFNINDSQYENHWKVGTNYYKAGYLGVTCDVPFKIIENPVKSISYVSVAEPIIENTCGYWDECSVWNEKTGKYDYEEYFRYYAGRTEGDKLTVNYKDGTSKTFTFGYYKSEEYGGFDYFFADSKGKKIPYADDLIFPNEQYENHWKIGTNYYTVSYIGVTNQVPVKIIECPVKSISYNKAADYSIVEKSDGYFTTCEKRNESTGKYESEQYFRYFIGYDEGDKLTVNYKDGTSEVYTYGHYVTGNTDGYWFANTKGKELPYIDELTFTDNQYEDHWEIGTNYFTVNYLGVPCKVAVKVVETPVKSLSYVPVKTNYIQNKDGWSYGDGHFEYAVNFNEGDKLTVNFKDGTKEVYTYGLYGYNGFITEKGVPMVHYPQILTNQYETNWKLGKNTFTFVYLGCETTVTVNVVKNVSYNDGTLIYEVNEDGKSLTVTGHKDGISGAVTIPSNYKDLPVKAIDSYAFDGCGKITSVSVPKTVETIGDFAFRNCKALTSVSIAGGLKKVNSYAFYGCEKLKSVKIPDTVTDIQYKAFGDCSALATATLPDSLKKIGSDVFKNTKLEKTTSNWKDGVLYVGNHLIKADVKKVPETYSVKYGTKVIADSAFRSYYDNGVYVNCANLKSLTVPSTVVTIGDYAFESCKNLKSVIIPNKVSYLGYNSFGGCTNLTSATVPESVKCMSDAFAGCNKLTVYCVKSSNAYYTAKNESIKYKTILSAVTLSSAENVAGGIKVSWKAKSGADSYTVYRKTSSTEWKKLATTSKTAYTDKTAKSGTKYYYTVSASNGNGAGTKNETGVSRYYLATPTVKTSNTSKGISVKWNKITGAKGYVIYKKTGSGKWTKLKTISSGSTVSYTDTKVKSGTKYSYYVKAYNGKTYSSYKASSTLMFLTAVKLSSATSGKSGITLKWSKVSGAKGYYVYRKTGSGSYKKLATVKSGSTVKYVDKSAKKGTTYTYYVKAYNGSYTGSYANALKCKDKY